MPDNVIPIATHPIARANAAAGAAGRIADRFGMDARRRQHLVADTRALVRAGCSAAWSITVARRAARRAAANPERA